MRLAESEGRRADTGGGRDIGALSERHRQRSNARKTGSSRIVPLIKKWGTRHAGGDLRNPQVHET